jgi:hypothetical protein
LAREGNRAAAIWRCGELVSWRSSSDLEICDVTIYLVIYLEIYLEIRRCIARSA